MVVGYGFIGRRIAMMARERGLHVRVNARRTSEVPSGVEFLAGDASDPRVAESLVQGADHVIYAAGTTKPAEPGADAVLEVTSNLAPLLTVLEAIAGSPHAPHVTLLSSGGTVYGPDAPDPAGEDTPSWPISSYGVLKVAAERFVAMYARVHGFSADILRCSNVYGPGQPTSGSQGVIGIFLAALREGRAITLYGDGSARRDFVHVDDVADVMLRLRERPSATRVLNVGSGEVVSILEVLELLAAEVGIEARVEHRAARPYDVPDATLDLSRLRATLPFEPVPLRDGISTVATRRVETTT